MPGHAALRAAAPPNDRSNTRLFHHSRFSPAQIARARSVQGLGVSVCLPARECAHTVGEIVGVLGELRRAGVIDAIVVVDADSPDGTAEAARRAGATVWQEAELMPSFGPVLGKGDAMWRALSVLDGELICFLDADTQAFAGHFATGLLGPLVCEPEVRFVKACYRRPLDAGGPELAEAGGRVSQLLARPALELFYPPLAGLRQPLAGEVAGRRELFERVPFSTGYGVEVGMVIDVWREVGLERMAQVDLGEHRHDHQPLAALRHMALTVLATIAARLEREGRLAPRGDDGASAGAPAPLERPPFAGVRGR
jgi:glucosyl-3-phosphoglycerate synthase